jgi:hypothetical protein
MLSTALKPKSDITDMPPTYFPKIYEWGNFIKVFQRYLLECICETP